MFHLAFSTGREHASAAFHARNHADLSRAGLQLKTKLSRRSAKLTYRLCGLSGRYRAARRLNAQKKPRASSARRRGEFCARGRTERVITLGKRADERRDGRHTTNKGGRSRPLRTKSTWRLHARPPNNLRAHIPSSRPSERSPGEPLDRRSLRMPERAARPVADHWFVKDSFRARKTPQTCDWLSGLCPVPTLRTPSRDHQNR
jgi:hypothetical protein